MANPQIENGHTKIANELMDAVIRYRLPGEQMQVFLFIIRKTYGWNKTKDAIPLSQFCEATGMKKPTVVRALNGLIEKTIIKKDNGTINSYSINKDFAIWKPLSKKITHKKALSKMITSVIKNDNGVIKNDNESLSKMIPSKDNTKDTIQKTLSKDRGVKRFTPPSLQEIKDYCEERNNQVDIQTFMDFYESKGWMIGKNKMKDWRAAVRTWESRNTKQTTGILSPKGQRNAERLERWVNQ